MTAQTYHTPAPLNSYLRRATFGLSATRREDVWNEMEEHVHCRAEKLEFQGLSAEQALKQALREMGPPLRVCLQLNGVHNMPKLIAFGTIIALTASASLYAIAQQTPPTLQLPVQTKGPHTECVKTDVPQPKLTLIGKYNDYNCYQDDTKMQDRLTVSYETLQQAFSAIGFKTELSPDGNIATLYPPFSTKGTPMYIAYKENGISYIDMGVLFLLSTSPNPFPAHFESYEQPSLVVGKQRVQVANGGNSVGQLVYLNLTDAALQHIYSGINASYVNTVPVDKDTPVQNIQTPFKAGEVIAAIQQAPSVIKEDSGTKVEIKIFKVSLGVTDTNGKVALQMPTDAKIVSTPQSSPSTDVLLLRLTNTRLGDMKSGILKVK